MSDTTTTPPAFSAQRLRRLIFAANVLAVLILSLAPLSQDIPSTGWDKSNHLLGFAVLMVLGCWAYPGKTAAILAGLFAYGALIELLQSFTTYRFAEWGDLLADALGLVLGWGLVRAAQAVALRRGRS